MLPLTLSQMSIRPSIDVPPLPPLLRQEPLAAEIGGLYASEDAFNADHKRWEMERTMLEGYVILLFIFILNF